ncbi:MAG: molybdopterin-dependent oxidoreductase [Pseudomonadota bacterium]
MALTISGKICWPNRGSDLQLDAPLLRQFTSKDLITTTDWPDLKGPQKFRGIALMDLLLAAGWRGNHVTFSGVDGYTANMLLPELKQSEALVANEWNGMPMQFTRFAPLWLVFPYDDAADMMDRGRRRHRSVWKLTDIYID